MRLLNFLAFLIQSSIEHYGLIIINLSYLLLYIYRIPIFIITRHRSRISLQRFSLFLNIAFFLHLHDLFNHKLLFRFYILPAQLRAFFLQLRVSNRGKRLVIRSIGVGTLFFILILKFLQPILQIMHVLLHTLTILPDLHLQLHEFLRHLIMES